MKKTQKKDAIRNIKKRLVSFLSVGLVIMFGLGGVFITRYMGDGINAEATGYYNDHNFKTYELVSSLGVTDDDIAQIKETEGVTDAEGVIRASGSLSMGDLNKSVELISTTERISVPEVVEGSAPAARDECMVAEDFAEVSGLKVGDRVKLSMAGISSPEDAAGDMSIDMETEDEDAAEEEDEEDLAADILYSEEFTITGLAKHPDYLRRKSVDVVVLPWAAIDKEATDGCYTHAFVKSEDPKGTDLFSDKYFEKTADTKAALEELTETLAVDSAKRAKTKAYALIDVEWENALAELDGAQAEIDSGEATLNSELAKARAKLKAAQAKLNAAVKKYTKKIRDGESEVRKAESLLKTIDKYLPDAEKYVNKLEKERKEELANYTSLFKEAQRLLNAFKKASTPEEKEAAANAISGFIADNETAVRKAYAFLIRDDVMKAAELIRDLTDGKADITGRLKTIRGIDINKLIEAAINMDILGSKEYIDMLTEYIESTQQSLDEINEWKDYISEYKDKRGGLYKKLDEKKEDISSAKKKLASEKRKYQAQIRNGWNLYYSKKSAYESKLEEAKKLLAENRELAEQKLEEAKAEVEKIECKWLVFDRRANAGYVDMKSNLRAVWSAGVVFGILFMIISAMVCLSTLTIIIEEQKKMVGTVKAFGFSKREILGKYMLFGVSASIVGCIAGILMALSLSGVVLKSYDNSGMYQFGLARSVIAPGITIGACLAMIAICALSTVIACSDILRSPASLLMKGATARKGSGYKKTSSGRKGGSLYSRLIVRNMMDDKARVLISVIIIAFSTLLVGSGISMKLAYDGMSARQIGDVFKYDVRVDLGEKVTAEEKEKIEEIMGRDGAEFLPASYETHIFRLDDRLDALYVLTGDPEKLGEYFAVSDTETGEALALPDDGVLAQKKMKESYGMGTGAEITMLNSELDEKQAEVKGVFQNYVGRLVITSPAGYRSIFDEEPEYNCYFVKSAGAEIGQLQSDILAVNNDISFEVASEFAKKFEAVSLLYNLIVYVTTGIAIIMSFMILSNLSNIFLNRKKTELTVMRINGFSIRQTKGYLTRETVVTTAAGVILGVLGGAALAPVIIRSMEQPDLQFVRSFHPVAWIIAVVLEVMFAVIINSLVFRKVKDLNFRDVA